jgi:hypothetical protein
MAQYRHAPLNGSEVFRVRICGGSQPPTHPVPFYERDRIPLFNSQGKSFRAIARVLNRDPGIPLP